VKIARSAKSAAGASVPNAIAVAAPCAPAKTVWKNAPNAMAARAKTVNARTAESVRAKSATAKRVRLAKSAKANAAASPAKNRHEGWVYLQRLSKVPAGVIRYRQAFFWALLN
jgi:hypothetical protein